MTSESETEQDSGSDEEQSDDESGSFEAKPGTEDSGPEETDPGSEGEEQTTSDEVDSDHDIPAESNISKKQEIIPFHRSEVDWKGKILEKYEQLREKSLFVRFPYPLPEQEDLEKTAKELCSRVIRVRRPRQNRTRYCFFDFNSIEDQTKALKELQKIEIQGKQLVVSTPRMNNEEFLSRKIEKMANKRAERKAKVALKKAIKQKKKRDKVFTSTIIVKNIPSELTISEIKEIFPNAVDVKVNFAKGSQNTSSATVTLPTPHDATIAKRKQHQIGTNNLKISIAFEKNVKVEQNCDQVNAVLGSPILKDKRVDKKGKKKKVKGKVGQILDQINNQAVHGSPISKEKRVDKKGKKKKGKGKVGKNSDQLNSQAVHGSTIPKGKRKSEEFLSIESPSPKRVKKNANTKAEKVEQTPHQKEKKRNFKMIKTKSNKKNLDKIKSTNTANKKHSKFVKKQN